MNNTVSNTLTKSDIKAELWRRSKLSFLLHPAQKSLYDLYHETNHKVNVWLCGRRLGKTFCLVTIAIEEALKQPNTVIKIVAPTKMWIDEVVRPEFNKILESCPKLLQPRYSIKNYSYTFPNKSVIQMGGSENGHAAKLRGSAAKVVFIDEAQNCSELKSLVKDIALPCTLTTKGKVIIVGTPPADPLHDFISFIQVAEATGTIVRKATYENTQIPTEELELLITELGGRESDSYKREIECQIIRDGTLSIVPEFNEDLSKEIIREWPQPAFFDCYEALDLGFRDHTLLLFAYYDFKAGKVVVEDELPFDFQRSDNSIPKFVEKIREKEAELWTSKVTGEVKPVMRRVSDLNLIVTSEISKASNFEINFVNAQKDDKEAAVNQLRLMISSKKIIIHPRCKTLLSQLKYGLWQANRKQFARSEDGSHADAIDALVYLTRSISYNRNPYPSNYGFDTRDLVDLKDTNHTPRHYTVGTKIDQQTINIMKKMFTAPKHR